ncbi:hypothetical protein OBBRIDRAFT_788327 [Obba rivulosa]|uniref:Thioredoxin domain-containing protein n=1 Tax=Obba rivulosa TaxID=1052685 RepID=A0A8E2J7Q7_9APHY|nr:hypothetical protein OBBRIDRAFT_788327 [Obba rivulosa]
MANARASESSRESAALNDFRTNIWGVFQDLYEDKWDQVRWDTAVARFQSKYPPAVLEKVWQRAKLPPWNALEEQLKKGPPPFLRPGWKSPLIGKTVDLSWIDNGSFECVKPGKDGWKEKKILILEFWASWCRPCLAESKHLSELAITQPDVKLITFNHEGIFSNASANVAAVKQFVKDRDDMIYPIYIDVNRIAIELIFEPGQNLSIPLAFIITTRDQVVQWVGNPEELSSPLQRILRSV